MKPLPPVGHLWRRLLRAVMLATILLGGALGIGVLGLTSWIVWWRYQKYSHGTEGAAR